ncbi:MAG: RnfABCDGE type electron transport complex subunit G [Deltaproteobacteria bacterium]|nr:RnfABCDGE type electron transport complex subunit G [Deltaproteobacteria bacterium]
MREMIRMVLAITILAAASGLLLAMVKNGTEAQIEAQKLKFVKGPVLNDILQNAANDPLADRFKLTVDGEEKTFFVAKYDGKPKVVAFESFGSGYGGTLGVMVAVDTETDKIWGIGVTTHSETPGLGARSKTDPNFAAGFKGLSVAETHKVKNDGGDVDALSGATITSRGVVGAVNKAGELYMANKSEILDKARTLVH